MIAEAIDTAITLGWALGAWLLLLAAICTIGLLGTIALTVWAWTAATRALTAPSWARGRARARTLARTRTSRPSRHTAPHHHQGAA